MKSTGKLVRRCLAGCCLTAGTVPALSQTVPVPVHWTAGSTIPGLVHAGTGFQADIFAAIDPGWHLYALQQPAGGPMATEIALDKSDTVELLRVAQTRPKEAVDPQFQLRTAYFEQAAKFTLRLRAEPVKEVGVATLHVLIRYQACNGSLCLPPKNASVDVPYRIRP